jgi:hypothetical protein
MNWDAIGAVGEVGGALAVVATLVYLAAQLRQNTRALQSATFQEISTTMGQNMEVLSMIPDAATLMLLAQEGLENLTAEQRIKFGHISMMCFRRIETVFVQESMGFVDSRLTQGFRRSALSALLNQGMREWWEQSKGAFSDEFAAWVDEELAKGGISGIHAGMGIHVDVGGA